MHMHHQRDATVRFSIQPPPYSIIMATTTRTQSKSPSEQRPTLHRLIESARWKQIHELFRLANEEARKLAKEDIGALVDPARVRRISVAQAKRLSKFSELFEDQYIETKLL